METPPGQGDDALRALQQRLEQASDAAERLIAEAAHAAAHAVGAGAADGAGTGEERLKPPPAGWQAPTAEADGSGGRSGNDLELLMALVHSLRELIPPELQQRVAAALRELLMALRALIDWYIERLERRRSQPAEVQDIPIL